MIHLSFTYNQKIISEIIKKHKYFSAFGLINYANSNFTKDSEN